MFSDANLAILDWPESFDLVVEQIIQPPAEAFGLLVSEIADIEGRILELPFELRSARFRQRVIKCPSMASATIQILCLLRRCGLAEG